MLFINLTEHVQGVEIMVEKEEDKKEKILEMTIEELDLSVRSYNCLKRAGINTVDELVQRNEEEMMKVRNLAASPLRKYSRSWSALVSPSVTTKTKPLNEHYQEELICQTVNWVRRATSATRCFAT